jgi:hypothetical protein
MRLSVVDPAKAKSEFEDAAKGSLILTQADIAQVQERGGWTDLDELCPDHGTLSLFLLL